MDTETTDIVSTDDATQAAPQAEAPTPAPADEQLGDGGKKALDAERRRARDLEKQLKAANERLTAIEDAEKTDLQRATDAAAKAKQDAEVARQELARERIARKHRLSDDDTALLSGTEEQMEALATRLATTRGPSTPPEGGLPSPPASPATQAAAATAAGDVTAAYAAKVRMLADMSKTK